MQNDKFGSLYVVATPMGNLQDISMRALNVLKEVDEIVAEDTRHATKLLNYFSIQKATTSLHNFNEREKVASIVENLTQGKSIALISDAGTPLISDPGFVLVRAALEKEIRVIPIPGACALIAALSVSGLATDRFVFEGFLPAKSEARQKRLTALQSETRTLIFYEAPHRLCATLAVMTEVFGVSRHAVVARELTKIYESVIHLPLLELQDYYRIHADEVRGEIVILVEGANEIIQESSEYSHEKLLKTLLKALSLKQAVDIACELTGERKNTLYEKALKWREK